MCQLVDSAPTNVLTADILGIDAVQCMSHLLHDDVTNWVKNTPALGETLNSTQETVRQLNASIKSSATIRNSTNRRPKMRNDIRWKGMHDVMKQFSIMREDLITANEDANSNFTMDDS